VKEGAIGTAQEVADDVWTEAPFEQKGRARVPQLIELEASAGSG
jgi:hypothetical protein